MYRGHGRAVAVNIGVVGGQGGRGDGEWRVFCRRACVVYRVRVVVLWGDVNGDGVGTWVQVHAAIRGAAVVAYLKREAAAGVAV